MTGLALQRIGKIVGFSAEVFIYLRQFLELLILELFDRGLEVLREPLRRSPVKVLYVRFYDLRKANGAPHRLAIVRH